MIIDEISTIACRIFTLLNKYQLTIVIFRAKFYSCFILFLFFYRIIKKKLKEFKIIILTAFFYKIKDNIDLIFVLSKTYLFSSYIYLFLSFSYINLFCFRVCHYIHCSNFLTTLEANKVYTIDLHTSITWNRVYISPNDKVERMLV